MKKLRKATTALLAVPSRLATVGKRAPSPTSYEKAITVETPDGMEAKLPDDGREAPAPTSFETAITVETPDGIEAIPVEMSGLLLSSPSAPSTERTGRAPTSRIEHAAPPGGAVVDSRDDDEGGRPPPPRGLGLDGGRALSRHRTFLASLEDELARDAAAALFQESRTDPKRSRTLSAHGDFLASLEVELTRDAAAMIRGGESAEAGDGQMNGSSSTSVGGAASSQSSPVSAARQRALVSAPLGNDARVNVEDGPTLTRDEALCSSSRSAEPEVGGINEAVKCPTPTDAEDSGSLRLSSSGLETTRENPFVSAPTKRNGVFDSTIGFETTGVPIDIIFGAAARALLCGNGTNESTRDNKAEQESTAREIDPEQATEMKGDSVEDHRNIDLD